MAGVAILLAAASLFLLYLDFLERSELQQFRDWAAREKCFGIVVTSDSPKWSGRIDDEWLARFGAHVAVLNHSTRHGWPKNGVARFVDRFNRIPGDHPVVIVPRKRGRPAVHRFRFAFDAASRGDDEALRFMQERLFKEYDEWLEFGHLGKSCE